MLGSLLLEPFGQGGAAHGLVQLGVNLVEDVGVGQQLEVSAQQAITGARACLLQLDAGVGDLFGDQGGGGALIAVRGTEAVADHVVGHVEGPFEIAGVEGPEHDSDQDVILFAPVSGQQAINPRLVDAQHGALCVDLAFDALDSFEGAAVFGQLHQLQLVGVGAHLVELGIGRPLQGGQFAFAVATGR